MGGGDNYKLGNLVWLSECIYIYVGVAALVCHSDVTGETPGDDVVVCFQGDEVVNKAFSYEMEVQTTNLYLGNINPKVGTISVAVFILTLWNGSSLYLIEKKLLI